MFQEDENILWSIVPFKVKSLKHKGKRRTAVEANFVEYKLTGDKTNITPDLKNWKNDVLTSYTSWKGNTPDLTLRNLLAKNFPEAKTL